MMINMAYPVHVDYSMRKNPTFIHFASISLCGKATACNMKGEQLCRHVESSAAYPAHLLTRYDLS